MSLLGVFGNGQQIIDRTMAVARDAGLPPQALEALQPVIENLGARQGAGLGLAVGLLVALWSASGYVSAFSRAMNRMHEAAGHHRGGEAGGAAGGRRRDRPDLAPDRRAWRAGPAGVASRTGGRGEPDGRG